MKRGLISFGILVLLIFAILFAVSTFKNIYDLKKRVKTIRVEVLNGTSRQGLAFRVSEYLRKRGFDVLYYGNADSSLQKTVIFDRTDRDCGNARIIKKYLKCGIIAYEPHPAKIVDVSVILGYDFPEKW